MNNSWIFRTLRSGFELIVDSKDNQWKEFFTSQLPLLNQINEILLSYSLSKILSVNQGQTQVPVEFWTHLSDEEKKFVLTQKEYAQHPEIWPLPLNVFKAFELTPLQKVKVVIIGQDPYHKPFVANGLAFSAQRGASTPDSLRNIFLKLKQEGYKADNPCLESWATQGVLLLNTALTVFSGQAESHLSLWKTFITELIKYLGKRDGLVWILWGKKAEAFLPYISQQKSYVLIGGHPSPINTKGTFMSGNYFQLANQCLQKLDKAPIDWNLEAGLFQK